MPFFQAVLLFLAGLSAFSSNGNYISQSPFPQPTIQTQIVIQTPRPTPTATPKPTPTATPTPAPKASTTEDYRHQVFDALNAYRSAHGVAALSWNGTLSGFAQNRSIALENLGKLDNHAGFNDFIHNQDGFNKLGFSELGENQSFSHPMPSAHDLIFGQYASSPPHNQNQLNTDWTDVGVGVSGEYSDIVFGGKKR